MRATLGERFKILLLDAGLSPEQAGKELHVSPRTIRYWISGKVLVPYAAYRLIRIMRLFDLPCQGWDGWHMHSGRLWSPEGYAFLPHDANWWALLVRRAEGFGRQYARANQLDVALQRLQERACEGAAGTNETGEAGALGRAALPGQNTLKTEFTPRHSNTGGKLSANITSWNLGDFPSLGLALKCWSKVTSTKSGSGYRGRSP
nr:VC1465 family Xer recombination activation factor [Rhodoferax sp. U2-2l]